MSGAAHFDSAEGTPIGKISGFGCQVSDRTET
jgi:hypothetical protein